MINPEHLKPKLSPLDWYKLGSSVLFVVLGGFLVFRFLFAATGKRFITALVLGLLILGYGIFRLWLAYRSLRRAFREPKEKTESTERKWS
jgi:uncharacterized membrane protein HdeD (DUF308 family)